MDKHESLVKEFQSLGPPVFSGSSDISVAEEWFREIEKKLGLMRLTDEERLILATSMLKGEASHWWDINRHTMVVEGMTWREFENSFLETYYPFSDRNMKKIELLARMEYLNRLEKKRDKREPNSSETTNSAVEMENLECNEIGGDVRMCRKLKEQEEQDGAPKEIGDVRMCSSLRKPEQQAHQAIQDGAPMEIVVRNLTMNGGQGTVKSSNLNSETHLQLQRKQPKPELAVVEVSIEMKETRQQSGHTMINIGEQQKQSQQNMKKYMHQLLSQKVQPLLQRKQQLPLALVESNVTEQKQQQPLALVESNVKEQKQQQQLALVESNVKEQKQQQPEVAVVDGTANMIETQQPEVAHAGSNIEEQQKELQLQKKHYMHRVLLQRVQQLLQRKQQLQPEHWKQMRLEHWKQLRHWQQLQQRQEELQQQIQQQQQQLHQQRQHQQQKQQQMQQQQQQQQLQQQQQQLQLQKKHYMHRVLFQRVQQLLHRKQQQLQTEHWKQLRHWQQLQQRQEELQQQIQRQHQQLHQQRQQQQQKQQQLQQMQWQQHQELQQLHQQHHQLQQLHQQRQQQKQKQQQQQQKQEHHKPKNERKQNKKRKHHEAEVALVQVNMEEFWANELNRKKAVKVKKQVQIMD